MFCLCLPMKYCHILRPAVFEREFNLMPGFLYDFPRFWDGSNSSSGGGVFSQ